MIATTIAKSKIVVEEDPPWAGLVTGLAGVAEALGFLAEGSAPSYALEYVIKRFTRRLTRKSDRRSSARKEKFTEWIYGRIWCIYIWVLVVSFS